MYTCKARIGLMIVAGNAVIEPEFNKMVPEGLAVHYTRMWHERSVEGLKKMADYTEDAAGLLACAAVDIIAYADTTGSLVEGVGMDQRLIRRIEAATGIQATTTTTAVMHAFRELKINKVAIACPYPEDICHAEKAFFEASGIKVVNMISVDFDREKLRLEPPEATYDAACEVDTPEADAVFISCCAFKSITVIEKLEKKLRKPVFSSNTATLWDILKRLEIREQIRGYGSLLTCL